MNYIVLKNKKNKKQNMQQKEQKKNIKAYTQNIKKKKQKKSKHQIILLLLLPKHIYINIVIIIIINIINIFSFSFFNVGCDGDSNVWHVSVSNRIKHYQSLHQINKTKYIMNKIMLYMQYYIYVVISMQYMHNIQI